MVRRTSKIVRRTLKSIWCDSQTKDERKKNGQKRAAMSHISGYVLDIYLAMPKRSVAAAPNTHLELSIIVIKLSIIVLNEIPIFLNIFVARHERIFVSK